MTELDLDFTEEELQHFESIERNSYKDLKNICLPGDPIFNATQPSDTREFPVVAGDHRF